jgi:hypothetical protein
MQTVYWRRDFPPLSEEIEGEHEAEAHAVIPDDLMHRTELWGRCYPLLISEAERVIAQEVARLGGSCAHVVEETIKSKIDDVARTFELRGAFRFILYRHP